MGCQLPFMLDSTLLSHCPIGISYHGIAIPLICVVTVGFAIFSKFLGHNPLLVELDEQIGQWEVTPCWRFMFGHVTLT